MCLKIILCDECEGWGKIQKDEVTDYHKNEKDYWYEKCDKCNGYGRFLETTENYSTRSRSDISNVKITVRKLNEKDMSIKERGAI